MIKISLLNITKYSYEYVYFLNLAFGIGWLYSIMKLFETTQYFVMLMMQKMSVASNRLPCAWIVLKLAARGQTLKTYQHILLSLVTHLYGLTASVNGRSPINDDVTHTTSHAIKSFYVLIFHKLTNAWLSGGLISGYLQENVGQVRFLTAVQVSAPRKSIIMASSCIFGLKTATHIRYTVLNDATMIASLIYC